MNNTMQTSECDMSRPCLINQAYANKSHSSLDRFSPGQLRLAMRKVDGMARGHVWCDGREMLMLASNNYLALAGDQKLLRAGLDALEQWGNSTSGSRLLNGTNRLHLELEEALSTFKQVESVAVFPSGYMANLGTLSALLTKDSVVIMDKLAHASIIDGCKLAGAELRTFRHQDIVSLERVLKCIDSSRPVLVVVDGIYSMDGDFARLPEIVAIAHRYNARVMVDDAHSTGVAGENGRGTAEHFGMAEPDIITGTLSKAFGCYGGFVGGSAALINFIKFNARSFIYSTSLCPSATAALIAAVKVATKEPERRENLWRCTHFLNSGLRELGYNTGQSETPIIPVILDSVEKMGALVHALDEDGIFVSPVAYPACPVEEPRARISLCSDHTMADMERVLDSFQRHGRNLGLLQ